MKIFNLSGSGGGSSGSAALENNINQVAHGFSVKQIIRHNGGIYTLATADNVSDAEALGIVTVVTDANNFTLVTSGYVTGLSGLVMDTQYFLDPSIPGALTATEPTSSGQVSKPLFFAISFSEGYFINYRGELLTSPVTAITSINADTTAAQLLTVGTSGTDFAISNPGSGSHVFNLPTASAVNRGALSSADWSLFNSKGTVTSVSGTTNRITSTGGATPIIDIAATYVGQSSVTTLGIITTGTWHGIVVESTYGGTGVNNGSSTITLGGNLVMSGAFVTTLTVTGTTNATLPAGTNNIGYLEVPSNSKSADYTAVLADSGKSIDHPATDTNVRTFTIPANGTVAYPVGTCLSFSNMTAAVVTIAITTDTLYLAGTGSTGSRSLAQYGVATARKLTSTTWLINGTGLS